MEGGRTTTAKHKKKIIKIVVPDFPELILNYPDLTAVLNTFDCKSRMEEKEEIRLDCF